MTDAEQAQVEIASYERAAREVDWLITQTTDASAKAVLANAAAQIRLIPALGIPITTEDYMAILDDLKAAVAEMQAASDKATAFVTSVAGNVDSTEIATITVTIKTMAAGLSLAVDNAKNPPAKP